VFLIKPCKLEKITEIAENDIKIYINLNLDPDCFNKTLATKKTFKWHCFVFFLFEKIVIIICWSNQKI